MAKKGFETLRDDPKEGNAVHLFKIPHNDLNDQTRQYTDDMDVLKFVYSGDISVRRF
jgi:hypothetical protein